MQLTIDASVRRIDAGKVLIGGSPLKLFRLTASGAELVDRIQRGDEVLPTTGSQELIDRLLDAGVLHRLVDRTPANLADIASQYARQVTVVIPAFNATAAVLTRLTDECTENSGGCVAEVVIVDDASQPPLDNVAGARVVRRKENGGPGAARSTGLEHVSTTIVAFVDTDVNLPANWAQPLLAHFSDDRVALVAPRVASTAGPSLLARYEMLHSPLDLGSVPARVRAGTTVSYVPAAALVCRVQAIRAVGGFDETMRVGEDVDLVWRLDEAGWRLRYEPAVTVTHQPRESLSAWLRQRHSYGTSASPLALRHPGALAPVRVSGWSAASWLAVAAGLPIVGVTVASVTTALLARKLRHIPGANREAMRLAGLGHLFAARSLASAVVRAWWPLAALAALFSKRARRAVLIAATAPAVIDWLRKRPAIDPVRYVGLRVLDDMSYGAGLAQGALHAHSLDALKPDFTSWPRSSRPTGTTGLGAVVARSAPSG